MNRTPPNIVFILIDDLGWTDLSIYGSRFYETPNLDRLAQEGMRFSDAYAACPVCSPTRASLLTGKYPATVGVTDYIDWSGRWHPCRGRLVDAPYIRHLPLEEFNLARALAEGGYATWHVGKWHLGEAPFYPDRQGFEVNIGGWEVGHPHRGYFSPWQIPTLPEAEPGKYLTDHLTDEAIRLIQAHDGRRPFFLNFWHYAVHTPIQAPGELVEKYKAKAARLGLDTVEAIQIGEPFPTENKGNQRVTRRIIQSDPVYAAMIENLDANIGRLLEVLPPNTLVLFTSDNGGLSTAEGAPTSNRPLAEGKGWMYEGGTRVPLIVRWPGVVPPGSLCPTPVTSPDFYPTLLEAAGLPLRPEQHVDGQSFFPVLRGDTAFQRGPLFWHYPHYGNQGGTPACAVRDGDWKLIEFFEDGRRELYQLREDIGETRDRAAAYRGLVRRLHSALKAWQDRIEAKIPAPNPYWTDLRHAPEKTDWTGQWIWTESARKARNVYGFFRRRFRLPKAVSVTLRITADTFYEAHVDGRPLGRGPARSHLGYYEFDRYTLRLKAGEHVMAVLVHHIGVPYAAGMTHRPGLLVEIEGPGLKIGSDEHWRAFRGTAWTSDLPCLMSHYGFWEECDQERVPKGWTELAFDDADWEPACPVGRPPCGPWVRLLESDLPPLRREVLSKARLLAAGVWMPGEVREDDDKKRGAVAGGWLPEVSTLGVPSKEAAARRRTAWSPLPTALADISWHGSASGDGLWFTLDFGRTVSGYPRLTVDADQAGIQLDLSYDDIVGPEGAVNPERTYARQTDRFRLAAGVQRVGPVRPRGFRFLTVDIQGVGAVRVRAVAVEEETYPLVPAGRWRCSDGALDSIAERSAETVRICTSDAFLDCVTRERVQWMQDLYVHAHVAAYVFGDTRLLRRALFQGAQNALPDGRINGFIPSERTTCAFASSSLVWLRLLMEYRLFSGDDDTIRRLRPRARKLLDFLATLADSDGLITSWPTGQFWDWAPIEDKGCLLVTNAFFIWTLARLRRDSFLRGLLKGTPFASVEALRAAAHRRFWDASRGLYRDAEPASGLTPIYSQQANTLAVLAGLAPPRERASLLRRLMDPDRLGSVPVGEQALWNSSRPDPETIVPVGTLWFGHFLCQALFEAGLAHEAMDQIRGLWGVYEGSPAFPETRQPSANTTQRHGWSGGPAWLLPAYALGVRPVAPGWHRVIIRPQPGGLTWASGQVPTPHGAIRIRWRVTSSGTLETQVRLPPGVTAVGS